MSAIAADAREPASERDVFDLIADDLDLLARLHDRELDAEDLSELQATKPRDWFALPLSGEEADAGFTLLEDACRTFGDQTGDLLLDELAADFAGLHLTHGYRAAPNESVWMTEEGLERQEPMFEVRHWYRRYALAVPDWRIRADDHLVSQLAFVARLLRIATPEARVDAGRFLDQHLMNWITDFAGKATMNCQTPFYAGLALVTLAHVQTLRSTLEALTGERRRPKKKMIAISAAPDPRAHAQAYVPGIQASW